MYCVSPEIDLKSILFWLSVCFWQKIKLADNMIVGSDFEVFAVLKNNCMKAKTCVCLFYARAVWYNGKQGGSCGFVSDDLEVPPGEGWKKNHPSSC